jgi:hypothetical protein
MVLALFTFVPSYYLYPSRGATLSRLTNFLGGVWVVLLIWILAELPGDVEPSDGNSPRSWLPILSLFYPIYYIVISWVITIARWTRSGSL